MSQIQVMNFLNEIANKNPSAVSFASGRPLAKYLDHTDWGLYEEKFTAWYSEKYQLTAQQAKNRMYHYGPSAGIICELLEQFLVKHEGIQQGNAGQITVTNGCQEALLLISIHELKEPSDCALAIDPCYVGYSGMLSCIGKKVFPIDINDLTGGNIQSGELYIEALISKVEELKQQQLTPKIIYVNPGFNNPLGYQFSQGQRAKLLKCCQELNIKIVEDDPYSDFVYDGTKEASIKSMDTENSVYYIGSFSKTFCPGVRIGFVLAPDESTSQDLSTIKSLTSVNTNSLSQMIIGGWLIDQEFSLNDWMDPINKSYRAQRNAMCSSLDTNMGEIEGINWDKPSGGFFFSLKLPFDFQDKHVLEMTSTQHVICMPVSYFSLAPERWSQHIRLAFSYYEPDVIYQGVSRLSAYIKQQIPG